ncbi:UDP-N-acetylglucosamine-peptide N-acetylglucosaminyltransferase [Tabrizicola sp. TH137]|uniref:tetratricopeptide repeat protein n=1 Tax=Tabrizicola sp. TH137 TaxID=2067452 RepID=UPI000C7C9E15|nr:tetratricopeptide repeat protein [Tabrizicola sp. TH137]PLL14737.1 UDP-N-acetylglucosamine-peptide N-acetylglucosaminyltransferase [Tabrizicola sp. TH137]
MARTSTETLGQTGLELARKGHWDDALPALRHAADQGSTDAQVHFNLGHALRRNKDYLAAAEAFRRAADLDISLPEPLLYCATALKEGQMMPEAEAAYHDLNARHPDYFTGWSLHGVFLKNEGRFSEAVTILQKALTLKDDIETRNTLVVSLCRAGREAEAVTAGRINLDAKDRLAVARFPGSPAAAVALTDRNPPFDATGRRRNIISFSLWGDNPVYVHGAIVNARLAPNMYYGWTCRFYCDSTVPADALQILRDEGAQVVMMTDPALQAVRPMWRFFASDDPDVDRFICRDTDSRLNAQELIAVEDWIRSGKRFHVMRDHIYHMELMLAGMWGGVAGVIPDMKGLIMQAQRHFNNRFGDQAFLMEQVWPLIRDDLCTHDSIYGFRGKDFPDAYRVPRPIHVGGAVKSMPHWRK